MSTDLSPKIKHDLNILADLMLQLDGYKSCFELDDSDHIPAIRPFDCSTSTMQRSQKAWNQAVTSYAFLNKEPGILEHKINEYSQPFILVEEEEG
jgi:hypothetical protein